MLFSFLLNLCALPFLLKIGQFDQPIVVFFQMKLPRNNKETFVEMLGTFQVCRFFPQTQFKKNKTHVKHDAKMRPKMIQYPENQILAA